MLAAGKTVRETALKVGVSERTIHRRLDDPAFVRRVKDLREQMVGRALGRLSASTGRAAAVLRRLLGSDKPEIQLKAARAVLELTLRVHDQVELADRLAEIEKQLQKRKAPR
jgi:hypothetical protein